MKNNGRWIIKLVLGKEKDEAKENNIVWFLGQIHMPPQNSGTSRWMKTLRIQYSGDRIQKSDNHAGPCSAGTSR